MWTELHIDLGQADVTSARAEKDTERSRKWLKMQKQWTKTVNRRQEKLKRRARKGIPDAVRGQVWQVIINMNTYTTDNIHTIYSIKAFTGECYLVTL
jgi:hypothetical protein